MNDLKVFEFFKKKGLLNDQEAFDFVNFLPKAGKNVVFNDTLFGRLLKPENKEFLEQYKGQFQKLFKRKDTWFDTSTFLYEGNNKQVELFKSLNIKIKVMPPCFLSPEKQKSIQNLQMEKFVECIVDRNSLNNLEIFRRSEMGVDDPKCLFWHPAYSPDPRVIVNSKDNMRTFESLFASNRCAANSNFYNNLFKHESYKEILKHTQIEFTNSMLGSERSFVDQYLDFKFELNRKEDQQYLANLLVGFASGKITPAHIDKLKMPPSVRHNTVMSHLIFRNKDIEVFEKVLNLYKNSSEEIIFELISPVFSFQINTAKKTLKEVEKVFPQYQFRQAFEKVKGAKGNIDMIKFKSLVESMSLKHEYKKEEKTKIKTL